MPSFISSSERAPSPPRWHFEFGYAIVLFLAIFAAAEIGLRAGGYRPSAPDDMKLWAFERSRVYGSQPRDVIVMVGASRVRLGIHTETLRRAFPGVRVVQLAINGTSPFGVLRDLADDPAFSGVVIYDLMERFELPALAEGADPFVAYFHREQSPSQRSERALRSLYLGQLAVLSPQFEPRSFLKAVMEQRRFPGPYFVQYLSDRSAIARPDGSDEAREVPKLGAALERTLQRARADIDAQGWMAFHRRVEGEAEKLRSRGGQLLFLRLPSSGQTWELEERYFPKGDFWDRMARETRTPHLHFLDVPEWRNLPLYDGSHLDEQQSREFTRRFADWLRAAKLAAGS